MDARILQAKQDLLERVYAGEAGVPVGEIPVINSGDPCDEEAIICEVDEDVSDPGYTVNAAAMTAAIPCPRPDKEVVSMAWRAWSEPNSLVDFSRRRSMDALKETVDVKASPGP